MAEIIVTRDNFESEVLDSKIPVLVDFWATWCGPCMMLAPTVEEIATEQAGKVKVCKINVDEQPELAQMFQIMSIPTVMAFRQGEVTATVVGVQSKETLLNMVK